MATPRRRNLALREVPRAAGEFASFFVARRRLLGLPKGDGRPVLVMPGLAGGDGSTLALRRLLRGLGYHVHAWRLGRNWGPTDRIIDGLGERTRGLLEQHGQKLTLIGHSLGGIYAREIARNAPDAVRHVITLGSPFHRPRSGSSAADPLFRALSPLHSDRAKDVDPQEIARPIEVPPTEIFTRSDGVVPWEVCTVNPGPFTECIRVRGSHSGLIHNPAVIEIICDRLALDEWKPYEPRESDVAQLWTSEDD